MRKNQGSSEKKFNDQQLVYMIQIFSVHEKIPIDYFFSIILIIFEFKHITHKGCGVFCT